MSKKPRLNSQPFIKTDLRCLPRDRRAYCSGPHLLQDSFHRDRDQWAVMFYLHGQHPGTGTSGLLLERKKRLEGVYQ